jgi:glycine/D-amino acid oxidase-like deaminating enzyme
MVTAASSLNSTGTPVRHQIYWRETEPVEPTPPLTAPVRADVCVIGAGYTGLWTAHYLKKAEPEIEIHVVEARYAGSGASGHGDGFITPTIGHNLASFVDAYGTEGAQLAYSVVSRSILEVQRFAHKHSIDAQIEPTGYLNIAANPGQMRFLERDLDLISKLGATPPELLNANRAREYIGSNAIYGAFKVGGALVNPHRLVRGLCRVVCDQGVHIHEYSPAIRVERSGSRFVVTTPRGQVTADRLVYATNAYQHQFPQFRGMVRPFWSYAVVTEPLTDEQLAQVHWPSREGFVEARNFIMFARLTAQNRLLIGGGPAPYHYGQDMDERHMRNLTATSTFRCMISRYFPEWRNLRFTNAYGGCLDMTPDLVPHVGALSDGVFYAHGYCGNGVALTNTVGKVLRDRILNIDSTYRNLLFVNEQNKHYPAEPLAWLGIRAKSAWMTFQDRYPRLLVGRRKPVVRDVNRTSSKPDGSYRPR